MVQSAASVAGETSPEVVLRQALHHPMPLPALVPALDKPLPHRAQPRLLGQLPQRLVRQLPVIPRKSKHTFPLPPEHHAMREGLHPILLVYFRGDGVPYEDEVVELRPQRVVVEVVEERLGRHELPRVDYDEQEGGGGR